MSFTGSSPAASTALRTDHYELTMLEAALGSGVASRRAVFEVFPRRLPAGRRYGVVAGTGRLVEAIEAFRFGPDELDALAAGRVVGAQALEELARYRFTGTIDGYREGELYFPSSPILTVESTFAQAVVLETLVLSVLNHDSAVASAGARMVAAAAGRPLIEMGSRRAHEEAAVAAARAAYLVGFQATSNLEAGRRYRVPTAGTASHAFILAHDNERSAFAAQVAVHGPGTTLLVDTYDIAEGIRAAVDVAGPDLGAIRIDSGDLGAEAGRARALLDRLGAHGTRIVVSGDLDEYGIEELAPSPVDAYGVGSKLVGGSGAPSAHLVYKLVAIASGPPGRQAGSQLQETAAPPDGTTALDGAPEVGEALRPVAKRSAAKTNRGGRKVAWRLLDGDGQATGELVVIGPGGRSRNAADPGSPADPPRDQPGVGGWTPMEGKARPLQVRLMEGGRRLDVASLPEAREHHRAALAELAPLARMIVAGPPALEEVDLSPARELTGVRP